MKKTVMAFFAVLFCFAFAHAHSDKHEGGSKFTRHFKNTLFAIAEKGQVSIEILLDEREYKIGKDVIGIVVHDSHDEDVEDAKLIVTVTGIAEPLKVTEKGGGLYLVPSSRLPKDGSWQLAISVKKRKIEDRVLFSFPEALSPKIPAGKL